MLCVVASTPLCVAGCLDGCQAVGCIQCMDAAFGDTGQTALILLSLLGRKGLTVAADGDRCCRGCSKLQIICRPDGARLAGRGGAGS